MGRKPAGRLARPQFGEMVSMFRYGKLPFHFIRHRPWTALASGAFLCLATLAAVNLWAWHHFRAAEQACRDDDIELARQHISECVAASGARTATQLLAAHRADRRSLSGGGTTSTGVRPSSTRSDGGNATGGGTPARRPASCRKSRRHCGSVSRGTIRRVRRSRNARAGVPPRFAQPPGPDLPGALVGARTADSACLALARPSE